MIDDLKTFVTVIHEASLTGAANVLCVSQSAISKRIQKLEELLGVDLFDRVSKPPRPTAIASRVYEQAVPLLGAWSHLLDIANEHAPPTGVFRFGLPQAVADVALFDAVIAMKNRFPALEVKLSTDWSPALLRSAEQGHLDAAVLMLPLGARLGERLTTRQIATLDVKVVQSRAKPLVKPKSSMRSLASHGWILNPDGCGYRAALRQAMELAGQPLKLSVDTYATDVQMRLVSAGLGLGLVPLDVLRVSPYRDQLQVLQISDFKLLLGVWLVHSHQTGNLKHAIDTLAESLTNCFNEKPLSGLCYAAEHASPLTAE
jgi:DNA-binding transcriptional LysR family regulator